MAAGVITIVGGGALLGLAGGGTLVVGINLLISSTPDLTLTQAAKLQVVLKEIILNAQKDIICAQEVLKTYKSNITRFSTEIKELQLQRDKDHKLIKNMEESLSYMEKAFKDMESFLTDFQGDNDDQNTDQNNDENIDEQNHDDQ
jgi:septal ring factor EnvC (AmiA/AmiB activator)